MQLVIMNRGMHQALTNRPRPAHETFVAWLSTTMERTLHCGTVGPEDDFFDLGGDSMSALALFAAIEERFGIALPLTTIYDSPTVTALAARIADRAPGPRPSCLVPIRPTGDDAGSDRAGDRDAVILIHGIGGHVFDLRQIGGALATSHAVAALRAIGLESGETPCDRIATMADDYACLLAAQFPNQRIHLIGYSFGGMIAIETARRLRAAGMKIGAVVLLDTYPHPRCWPRAQRLDVRLRRMRHQAGVLARSNWRGRRAYLKSRLGRGSAATVETRTGWLDVPGGAPPGIRAVWIANSAAIDAYRPDDFDLPVTFVQPHRASVFLPTNPRAVWQSTLPQLTIEPCPGDHISMLGRDAPALADLLGRLIAEGGAR